MTKVKLWLTKYTAPGVLVSVVASFIFTGVANAAAPPVITPPITTISGTGGILGSGGFLCNLVGYFFEFLIVISVIMVLYGAFTYLTAGDDSEKTSKARRIITYAAIGIAVAIIADALPSIVNSFFTSPATGVGNAC